MGRTVVLLALAVALLAARATSAADRGDYTRAQAAQGELVYVQHCARCHGAQLEGAAAPTLAGGAFGESLKTGKMASAQDLYHFISTAMPLAAPGSLSPEEYRELLAFILSRNGYPAGDAELTADRLEQIALLPYPGNAVHPAPALTPIPEQRGRAPWAGARVDLGDAAMQHAEQSADDWPLPGRTYTNQRYSPLSQIDTANVANLVPVAIVHTKMPGSFETTPIVVDGVMYATTPVFQNHMKIMALDAANGHVIWSVTRALGPYKVCCGPNNRGATLGYGNVYFLTLDDKLVALDARTGEERWESTVADPKAGYTESMQPQVFDGMLFVGSAGGEWALRGFVAAYDARTGKQRWRWYTTDPKSYSGDSWKTGGGTIWTTPAIDARNGLVIFGTGNPNPDLNGDSRKGDNLYTDSIVALDARTGRLRWYYQEVKHDLWDYDATSNVVLFDARSGGKTIPAAGEAGKVGWFFIVDRATGKLIRKSQPFVKQNANMFKQTVKVLPGANGGSEWSPPAFSPRTRRVYVLGMNQLMDFRKSALGKPHPGYFRVGSTFVNTKAPKVQQGTFSAIDVDTGKIAWQYLADKPLIGGVLATGGDLVFTGEHDGSFEAFDARNGKKLWRFPLAAGVNAPPISYAVNGTQYVAVAVGGNFQLDYTRGDEIAIFKLKSR